MMYDFSHNDQNGQMKIDKRHDMRIAEFGTMCVYCPLKNHDLRSHTDRHKTNIDTKNVQNAGALLMRQKAFNYHRFNIIYFTYYYPFVVDGWQTPTDGTN